MTAVRRVAYAKLAYFAAAVIGAGGALGEAAAQGADSARFPSKPIRVIVPFPPGGSNDILGRVIAQKMSERLGQQAIVDNRGGADGIIGTELAARSPADGHTLLIVSTSYAMNPAIHKLPYDPVKSLIPISLIGSGANVLAVTPSLPVKTLKDLIALAKARPGQLHYASSGIGGFNHFGGELFKSMAGVNLQHVPYKGGGPAMVDVMTGQVEVLFGTLIQALTHLRTGKLRPLGVGSAKRSPVVPDVPTISEAGVAGYDGSIWWGILGPAGIPQPIVTRLNTEIGAILRDPDMAKRLNAEAAEPLIETPEAFGKLIAGDLAKWQRIAKQAGIRAD
ncbi:MAG TPA: tripartite tricarboxylate transporter substrate binding protein [Burkholderiales bacterium]|nr:tripartite tricarboxylate transporter substrate binding protein [Burkholderiales bacterium]